MSEQPTKQDTGLVLRRERTHGVSLGVQFTLYGIRLVLVPTLVSIQACSSFKELKHALTCFRNENGAYVYLNE